MKQYLSSFIGIPLPDQYVSEFHTIIKLLNEEYPFLDTVNINTPHITLYFLGQQTEATLEDVTALIRPYLSALTNNKISIQGLKTFTADTPRVIYLTAKAESGVPEFYQHIRPLLGKYQKSEARLTPHLTLARLRSRQAREQFYIHKKEIEGIISVIDWQFLIDQVFVYGVESTAREKGQQVIYRLALMNEVRQDSKRL